MRMYVPVLLLAAAIGCTKTGGPTATVESVESAMTEASTRPEVETMALPDASATVVKFFCPGMT